jgi:hypothetical protein
MRLLRPIAVLLLLTVWFAAKEHCTLEAAGLIAAECAKDCGRTEGHNDACDLIEGAGYRAAGHIVAVAAPQLLVAPVLFLTVPETDAVPADKQRSESFSEAETLPKTWRFAERAAPPSRAPSLLA